MIRLLEELEKNNISITLNGDELEVSFDGTIDPLLVERLRDNKSRIISFLKKYPLQREHSQIGIAPPAAQYPLSNAQKRLWILCHDEAQSITYNLANSIVLNGDYDPAIFTSAVHAVIARHEILRTVFVEDTSAQVCQRIIAPEHCRFDISYKDYSALADGVAAARAYMETDMLQPFNLSAGPLIRAALLQLSKEHYIFYYNIHHIISDGWSMGVLGRDVMAYYTAIAEAREALLPALRIQYKDYAVWQLARLEAGMDADREYWTKELSGVLPRLDYPTSLSRPLIKTFSGHNLETTISATLTAKLNNFCREEGGSLFMALLALWKVLSFRYTAQRDIVIGSAIAGRDHEDLEDQIGFYVNTLALRSRIETGENFRKFFRKVKQQTLSAFTHQSYPFDRVVEDLGLQYENNRSAVFDVMLVLQNETDKAAHAVIDTAPDMPIRDSGPAPAMFDLTINFQEYGDSLFFQLNYNTDVYDANSMHKLMRHYRQLVESAVADPDKSIDELDYMPAEEKEQLCFGFNNSKTLYPREGNLVDLFKEQAVLFKDRIAVIFEETSLSYAALDRYSDALAAYIRVHFAITPGQFIGIRLERSHWLSVAVLAVLKCGCAYVPVDPQYPEQRIDYMVQDSGCSLIINQDIIRAFEQEDDAAYALQYSRVPVMATDLAYLMYTSGSTGLPKGVMIEHRGIIRLVKETNYYRFDDAAILLSTGSFSFDATTFEFWGPLLHGGRLVLCAREALLDTSLLSAEIVKQGVNIMWFTSGWLNQLVDTSISLFAPLKTVLAGGDRLSPVHIRKLRGAYPDLVMINGYGPTENTTFSLAYTIEEAHNDIPLGYPIGNSTAYVLDAALNLVPVGVPGEICLGGDGLARGYHNQPALTAEKFVANPFHNGERLYRTGDLGKWDSQGRLLFLGRLDNQVKIRGHRIEPGEIEAQLLTVEGIRNGVALIRELDGEPVIAVYFEATEGIDARSLRKALQSRLPDYMLPEYYVSLVHIPLNANGKVDRDALPPLSPENALGEDYVAPRNTTEEQVVALWQEILGRNRVGINDDFFASGGHSLKAMRLLGAYQQVFGRTLKMKDLFTHLSPRTHAALILDMECTTGDNIPLTAEALAYPLSPAQRRLWIVSQSATQSAAYNMPSLAYLFNDLDVEMFKRAIYTVVERHEILRTVFREATDGSVMQWVLPPAATGFEVGYKDFRNRKHPEQEALAFTEADAYENFDLAAGPLLRVCLLQYSDSAYIFYYNMHHIISDGTSMQLLATEVMTCYEAYRKGVEPELPVLTIQYKDYSAWQQAQVDSEAFKASEAYWLQQYSEAVPELRFSVATGRKVIAGINAGRSLRFALPQDGFYRLETYARNSGTTFYMNFLTLLGILLHRYSYLEDLVIGSPVSGRSRDELKHQIGLYVNTLAFRISVTRQQSYAELLQEVKQKVLDADQHKEYPFDLLVQRLRPLLGAQGAGLFKVMLIVNHYDEEALAEDDPGAYRFEHAKHKFDLSFYFNVYRNKVEVEINYDASLFEDRIITIMADDFKALLEWLTREDTMTVGTSCKRLRNEAGQEEHETFTTKLNTAIDEDF